MVLFCNPEVPVPGMGGPPDLSIDHSSEELEVLIRNLARALGSALTYHHHKTGCNYGTCLSSPLC